MNASETNREVWPVSRGLLSCLLGALVMGVLALVVAVSPAQAVRTVYVTNETETVSAFSIASNGSLSAIPGSPFAVGAPIAAAITPDGRYLYVADDEEGGHVSAFAIDPGGGLTRLGSPYAAGAGPARIALSPNGKYLYTPDALSNNLSAFAIAPDGSLTPVAGSPFAVGADPRDVAITPDGTYLYVTNAESNNVYAFAIAANGGLSAVKDSPFTADVSPEGGAITPNGRYLYVIENGFNSTPPPGILVFSISSEGGLSPVPGSPFAPADIPSGIAISPDGTRLFTGSSSVPEGVSAYSIALDGSLSVMAGSPFPSGGFHGVDVAVSPDGRHLYETNYGLYYEPGESSISGLSVASDGSLAALPGSPFLIGGERPLALVVSPDEGPEAAFTLTAAPATDPTLFDATASSDPDYPLTSYRWEFGDGHTETTSIPTSTHTYAAAGAYTATLTVTDEAGCSTTQTFTGHTVSCNGSPLAQTSHQLTVPTPELLSVWLGGSGSGTVTSSPAGMSCPSTCTYAYAHGSTVTLTATPSAGSTFAGWLGCKYLTATSCEVTMNEATEVAAVFLKEPEAPTITPFSGSRGGCANGGVEVTVGGHTAYICNGAAGSAGANGANGKEGGSGREGPQGKEGPRGPAGPAARVTCKVMQENKQVVRVTCTVTDGASGARVHLRWLLTRAGHTVRHGASEGALRLDLHHLRPGRYLFHVQGQPRATPIVVG